jgi:hypothetical protein
MLKTMNSIPDLHDAELYAMHHDASAGTIQCFFRTEDSKEIEVILTGVTKFRCTDFGLQNVVLICVSTAWQEITTEELRSYIAWVSTTVDGEQLAKLDQIELVLQNVLNGSLHCIFVLPSWGAQMGAVAEKVEWRQLQTQC